MRVRTLAPPDDDRDGGDGAVTVGFHANVYESDALRGIDAEFAAAAASSRHRMARMGELAGGVDRRAEAVISDTADRDYTIHGTPRPADPAQTLNSVLLTSPPSAFCLGRDAPTAADKPALTVDRRSMGSRLGHAGGARAPPPPYSWEKPTTSGHRAYRFRARNARNRPPHGCGMPVAPWYVGCDDRRLEVEQLPVELEELHLRAALGDQSLAPGRSLALGSNLILVTVIDRSSSAATH